MTETARHLFLNARTIRLDCISERDMKNPLLKRRIVSLGGDNRLMYFETWRGTNTVHKMAVWNPNTWNWLYIPEHMDELSPKDQDVLVDYAKRLGIESLVPTR